MTLSEDLVKKVRKLPDQPGVYRYLNNKGKIIYIGKAKSLRKRVSSYFSASRNHSYRIRHLISNIHDLAYTITNSEVEALLLENNLIKNHQPKYNILLKDGKTYPYICISSERFPRVYSTRHKVADGSLYFGPYPNVGTMRAILNLIRGLVKLRNCTYNLSEANIKAGKFKVCLEYQIDNCAGPCVEKQSEEDYREGIEQIKHILRGNMQPVLKRMEELMKKAAKAYEFEKAEYYRKKHEQIKAYRRRNRVVSEKINALEVLTIDTEQHLAVVNHFKVQNGAIIQTHAWEIKRNNQEDEVEILGATLAHLMADDAQMASEIVTNISWPTDLLPDNYRLTVPKRGDKKHLLELSLKNCKLLLTEKLYKQNFKKRVSNHERMMQELQQALSLKELPDHIECFDNSNFQGSSPVASVVVFKDGKPAKREYRHFNIKTVEGPDDFASMEEIVERRYQRLLNESQPLPKLIIIDGGKGQLNSAAKSLRKLDLLDKIPIIGIAKRLEEIYAVGDPIPLHIDKKSPGLHLIQQLRNEAHRFAITFHRNKRSNALGQTSNISQIKGIGPVTAKKILQEFRSIKKLKLATDAEIEAKIGKAKAEIVRKAIARGEI